MRFSCFLVLGHYLISHYNFRRKFGKCNICLWRFTALQQDHFVVSHFLAADTIFWVILSLYTLHTALLSRRGIAAPAQPKSRSHALWWFFHPLLEISLVASHFHGNTLIDVTDITKKKKRMDIKLQ